MTSLHCRLQMDVTVKESIQSAVETISRAEGMLHILVNKYEYTNFARDELLIISSQCRRRANGFENTIRYGSNGA